MHFSRKEGKEDNDLYFTHIINTIIIKPTDHVEPINVKLNIKYDSIKDTVIIPLYLTYKLGDVYVYKFENLNTSVTETMKIYFDNDIGDFTVFACAILPYEVNHEDHVVTNIKWLYNN